MKLPWRTAAALDADAFATVRMRAIFECCKWDPQVGDVATLCPTPIVLEHDAWQCIAHDAEQLARETLAAERELLVRPDLHHRLGLPRAIRRWLADAKQLGPSQGAARLMRFDFHHTTAGWRISECNSDVPGGFVEAGGFTRLMAEHYPDLRAPADPAAALAGALHDAAGREGATTALIHATAYSDDQQVMVYLADRLRERGMRAVLMSPDHLRWVEGRAVSAVDWEPGPIDLVVRFFPAEWLIHLPRRAGWASSFRGGRTPQCNPASALLTQSKRFPLVWAELRTELPTWQRLLPATRDIREVARQALDEWVLKPALGRVGDGIAMPGVTPVAERRKLTRAARWRPGHWVAQQPFEPVAMPGETGSCYPCIGVYTVGGRVAGAYGRVASQPLVDASARDIAVLIAPAVAANVAAGIEPGEPSTVRLTSHG